MKKMAVKFMKCSNSLRNSLPFLIFKARSRLRERKKVYSLALLSVRKIFVLVFSAIHVLQF